VGDPGLGKSTILEWIHENFSNTSLVSGSNTISGLTASVESGSLRHGALTKYKNGLILVDELDKIKEMYIFDESLSLGSVSMTKSG